MTIDEQERGVKEDQKTELAEEMGFVDETVNEAVEKPEVNDALVINEAPEEIKMPTEADANFQMPEGGVALDATKEGNSGSGKKSGGKTGIIVGIIAAALIIAGGALAVAKPWGKDIKDNDEPQATSSESISEQKPSMEAGYEDEKTSLSQDDLGSLQGAVRSLSWHFFGIGTGSVPGEVYTVDGGTDRILQKYVTMPFVFERAKTTECRGKYSQDPELDQCITGNQIRSLTTDWFGIEFDNTFGLEQQCPGWGYCLTYNEEYDEFFMEGGRDDSSPYLHEFEDAVVTNSEVVIFERVARITQSPMYVYVCPIGTDFCTKMKAFIAIENEMPGNIDITDEVKEHIEDFGHYKWTFKKNENGTYRFVGVEEVK